MYGSACCTAVLVLWLAALASMDNQQGEKMCVWPNYGDTFTMIQIAPLFSRSE
jgi:hypothetical protein